MKSAACAVFRVSREPGGIVVAVQRELGVPVKLVWHASREADLAHAFLRKQVLLSSKDVVTKGWT